MYVSAIHEISDPEKFWGMDPDDVIPEGVVLHSALPNGDGSRAVCLWEADSLDTVQKIVEENVGQFSQNEYFEINAENARGLPASTTT
jgi:hypothetical protein